jgi:hypothetical protein
MKIVVTIAVILVSASLYAAFATKSQQVVSEANRSVGVTEYHRKRQLGSGEPREPSDRPASVTRRGGVIQFDERAEGKRAGRS